jgi:hypothetical protein
MLLRLYSREQRRRLMDIENLIEDFCNELEEEWNVFEAL